MIHGHVHHPHRDRTIAVVLVAWQRGEGDGAPVPACPLDVLRKPTGERREVVAPEPQQARYIAVAQVQVLEARPIDRLQSQNGIETSGVVICSWSVGEVTYAWAEKVLCGGGCRSGELASELCVTITYADVSLGR